MSEGTEPSRDGYRAPVDLRTDQPHSARVYDYILGGKDHFAPDREAAEAMLELWPAMPVHMRTNREFMHRAVRYLALEAGIRQFLDIGTGLPTRPNLHEVAQAARSDARVVYVDNDPIVLSHARALMSSDAEGTTAFVDGDMRDPDGILASPALRGTLDLTEPVALTVIAMVHFMLDGDDAYGVVDRLMAPLPAGSYLAMSIGTADFAPEEVNRVAREYQARGMPMRLRDRTEAERFFAGMELVEPGVVQVHHWRPDPNQTAAVDDADVAMYGGVARKL